MFLRCVRFGSLLLFASSLQAAPLNFETLQIGSRTYTNVTILGASATDLFFTHAQGTSNVKLKLCSAGLQKRFEYDPQAATEAERLQAEEDAKFYKDISSNLAAKMETAAAAAAAAARRAAATSEESLADPISEQSLLGKPAPPFEVQKWLGEKPALEEKFVLIAFWEPWSIACRKCIPQLNALQKALAGKLVVAGVASESQTEIEALAEPKLEFACAIDSTAKLRTAAGATSVPYALLLDPKGIVRFQGHPAALDEAKLRRLLAKPAE